MTDIQVRLVEGAEREAALAVEEKIFREENYPYDYRQFDDQSRVFGAFDGDICIGALRMIGAGRHLPPFITDCQLWHPEVPMALFHTGQLEELGTVVVVEASRSANIALELYRAAFQTSRGLGVTHWGIVMEAERTEFLNTAIHTTFEQCGDIGFHDWAIPPYIMDLLEFEKNMHDCDPAFYAWATEGMISAPVYGEVL
ncbi:hypothetical protein IPM44_03820 [bacterium]|nr:MAG: hypothetical protein IPM44_03820 [bacterium]